MTAEQTLQGNLRFWSDIECHRNKNSVLAECIGQAADRLDELERQLAEAREDTKRLDWMVDKMASISKLNLYEDVIEFSVETPWGDYETRYDTPRQAIDAAIAQQKVKP